MRVCFLGDATEMHLKRWVSQFSARDCEVLVVTLNTEASAADYPNCRLEIIATDPRVKLFVPRVLSLPSILWKLNRLLNDFRPNVIHSHSANTYSWLPMLAGARPRLITPWGSDILIHARNNLVYYVLTKLALVSSDMIHCDGINTQTALLDMGVDPSRIIITFFGTDTEIFAPRSDKNELRSKYNLTPNQKVIISIRTLTQVHGVITFIEAMPAVVKAEPNMRFLIGGDGPLRGELEHRARELGVFDSIQFLGRLNEKQVAEALAVSDLYVSTSLSESGLAGSTAEAMSTGLPIINTDTGDIRDWIEDGETGYIIPHSDPVVLAEKIILAINDDKMKENARSLNRKAIEERNNIKIEMDKMLNVYTKLARNP